MTNTILMLLVATFQISVFAADFKSAHRDPGVPYQAYILNALQAPNVAQSTTPLDRTVVYGSTNLPDATEWESDTVLLARFEKLRDERWLDDRVHPQFLRRSSWLYPDDGCFARAALAIMNLSKWAFAVPSKIFVFGNLVVKTKNSPDGEVSWWYHVAPVVQLSGQKYVLDPAIESHRPLPLEDWLRTMSTDISQLQVAICSSGSYFPSDECNKVTDGVEAEAASDQVSYLADEWQRLEQLSRDPKTELGDLPPWL